MIVFFYFTLSLIFIPILFSVANDFKVIAVELSFSTKDDIYIEATDAVLAKLKELREKHNLNINGPVSMRFSAASSQYLSMAYNEDMDVPRAYIEMAILLYVSDFEVGMFIIFNMKLHTDPSF